MTALSIAKKDFQDAVRSKTLWLMSVVFIIFAGGATYFWSDILENVNEGSNTTVIAPEATYGLVNFLGAAVVILVPVIALLMAFKAIAGERESGSIRVLLGLPNTRRDMVVGKLLGRALTVTVSILVGFLSAALLGLVLLPAFDFLLFIQFTILTIVLALAYTSIAVAISSMTSSTSRAAMFAVVFWLVFQFLWREVFGRVLYYLSNDSSLAGWGEQNPDWLDFFLRLSPTYSFGTSIKLLEPASIEELSLGTEASSAPDPFYLEPWFALVILFAWVVVPVGLGYLRFDRLDL